MKFTITENNGQSTQQELMEEIYDSYTNGNGRQMVEQIDKYGTYDFFTDFAEFLYDGNIVNWQKPFVNLTIKYHRIKGR